MDSPPRLLLFTGMNRKAAIFRRQVAEVPGVQVVPWRDPQARESLGSYAQRLADGLVSQLGADCGGPLFVGGCSFGGVIALEVAWRIRARACFLIASVRSPRECPPWMRVGRAIPGIARALPWMGFTGSGLSPRDRAWRAWAMGALATWKPDPRSVQVPVRAIHGACDRTFPLRYVHADVVVPGAGHVLCVTHADAVNDFLRASMRAGLVR